MRFYPHTVNDLLKDPRYLDVKRHLRESYVNPFTDKSDWQLVAAPDGGIRGVQVVVELPAGMVNKSFVFTPMGDGLVRPK